MDLSQKDNYGQKKKISEHIEKHKTHITEYKQQQKCRTIWLAIPKILGAIPFLSQIIYLGCNCK